jgi:hypothetical protein
MSEDFISNQDFIWKRKVKMRKDREDLERFDVTKPGLNFIGFFFLFLTFIFGQYYYLSQTEGGFYYMLLNFALTAIPILLMANLGPKIAEWITFRWLKKRKQKNKRNNILQKFLGFPSPKTELYLEAYPVDLNFSRFSILVRRITEVLMLSIGLTFTLTRLIMPFFYEALNEKWDYGNMDWAVVDSSIWMGPLALLLLFPLIPFFWINEDAQVYAIDYLQNAVRVGRFIRQGPLSKLLGFLGIILAYDAAQSYAVYRIEIGDFILPQFIPLFLKELTDFDKYYFTFREFGLIILAGGGAAFISSTVYLLFFHSKWVNRLRDKSSHFLPIGSVMVPRVPNSRLVYLKKPTEEAQEKRFRSHPAWIILQVLILLATGFGCFYLGFLY